MLRSHHAKRAGGRERPVFARDANVNAAVVRATFNRQKDVSVAWTALR